MEATEKREEQKKKPFRLRRKLTAVLALAALLALAFGAGALLPRGSGEPVITTDLISQRLDAISELATVEYHYTNMGKFENQVDFYGWKVPLTKKSFIVSYDGTIKAGVDLSEVQVDVSGGAVTVTLPEARVLSHEIDGESIQIFDETKNIFNPLQISDYTGFTSDQKKEVEQRALEKGLLTEAAEKAAGAVERLLNLTPGMEAYDLRVK